MRSDGDAWVAEVGVPRRGVFGRTPEGEIVETVELAGAGGLRLRVMSLGAAIQALSAPDRHGQHDNLVLGYSALLPYLERNEFFGAVVGRYANRIGGAAFVLDGERHVLAANEGANVLHGGARGFFRVVWRIDEMWGGNTPGVRLSYRSAEGEEGFPGTLDVSVEYTLEGQELCVAFEATADRPTVVSLTSHPYFNLEGAGTGRDVLAHVLELAADAFTPVDDAMIPTGELRVVEGTPFDLREPQVIGDRLAAAHDREVKRAGGFDHNFVLRGGKTGEPKFAARLVSPASGRVLELFTTEPGLQVYTGQKLGSGVASTPAVYGRFAGLAIEPQHFPDAPNRPEFPSARLDPGQVYRHVSVYRFSLTH